MRSFWVGLTLGLSALLASCGPPPPRAAVYGNRVIVQERLSRTIYALDAKSGKTVAAMPGEGWADAPASHGRLVYFHGQGGLVARDMDTGDVKWRSFVNLGYMWPVFSSKNAVFVPQLVRTAFLGRAEQAWVAFDPNKGSKMFELASDPWAPFAASDDIAVTIQNGELVGYDAGTGKERWRSTVKADRPVLVENGRVFARSEDKLAVFTASSGALQRRIDLGGTDAFGWTAGRLVPKGALVAWVESHVVHVADAATGKEAWRKEQADLIAVSAGVLVASRGEELQAYDLAVGTPKWKLPLDDDPDTLFADAETVVARYGSTIIVVDAATGKRRYAFDTAAGKLRR